MKIVVTGMDLRLVGDIGNCTIVILDNARWRLEILLARQASGLIYKLRIVESVIEVGLVLNFWI